MRFTNYCQTGILFIVEQEIMITDSSRLQERNSFHAKQAVFELKTTDLKLGSKIEY